MFDPVFCKVIDILSTDAGVFVVYHEYLTHYYDYDYHAYRGIGTGTASTAVAVPLLWGMRLSRTKIGEILMTSLRLALALTPAAQVDKRGTVGAQHSSCSVNLALSQRI